MVSGTGLVTYLVERPLAEFGLGPNGSRQSPCTFPHADVEDHVIEDYCVDLVMVLSFVNVTVTPACSGSGRRAN